MGGSFRMEEMKEGSSGPQQSYSSKFMFNWETHDEKLAVFPLHFRSKIKLICDLQVFLINGMKGMIHYS